MASKRIRKKRAMKKVGVCVCALCGRALQLDGDNYFYGKRGVVCQRCINTAHILTQTKKVSQKPETALALQALLSELNLVVSGQEEAKQTVALALWKQQLRASGIKHVPGGHLLLYGPSGCGKTFLASQAARLSGLPYLVFDATSLSEAGYKGKDAEDILKEYKTVSAGHEKAEYGVIILDEIDKLSTKGSQERQAYSKGTQHSLLKLLERGNDLLFILCGAFYGLGEKTEAATVGFIAPPKQKKETVTAEDFFAFGMERELIGRIYSIISMSALSEEEMLRLLQDKKGSIFFEYKAFFKECGVELHLSEAEAMKLVCRSMKHGTGVRALRAELERCMQPLLLRLAEGTIGRKAEVRCDI